MNPAVELSGVSKTFRDFWMRPKVKAVDSLDLEIARGEVFGLLGPNGSGKSTTIKMILGLLSPDCGKVLLDGLNPRSVEARRSLGYLPELSYLHPFLTAEETLWYYAGLCSLDRRTARDRISQLIAMAGLEQAARRAVGSFSKGMARRVALACALVGKPSILVLDEPTSGLDPVTSANIHKLISKLNAALGATSVVVTHDLQSAMRFADRILLLKDGRVAECSESAAFAASRNPDVVEFLAAMKGGAA